jgi:chemotaxis protein MotB
MNKHEINPYIALADLGISLVLIFVFFIAAVLVAGQAGWEQTRYKNVQEQVIEAINNAKLAEKPQLLAQSLRSDPPGVQRWVFIGQRVKLFGPGQAVLNPAAKATVVLFAKTLKAVQIDPSNKRPRWQRIRIEGHTMPRKAGENEPWGLSAARAAAVAELFSGDGGIAANFLAVAGRGGQTLFNGSGSKTNDPRNERVEIIIEYK